MLYTNTFESRQILQSLLPGFLHLATKANPGRHRSTLLYYDFPSQDIILTLSMHSFPHTQLDFRFVHLATISLLFHLAAAAAAAVFSLRFVVPAHSFFSPFIPGFFYLLAFSDPPAAARLSHDTELVPGRSELSAALVHDVLLNAKTQRKCATSRALRTPVDRRIEPQGSKAAPLLRYHMGSAMATEQYPTRRWGNLYTVRASTQVYDDHTARIAKTR